MYDPVVVIAPVVIFRLFLLARESHTNLSVLCVWISPLPLDFTRTDSFSSLLSQQCFWSSVVEKMEQRSGVPYGSAMTQHRPHPQQIRA
jgi:hypothetical protein